VPAEASSAEEFRSINLVGYLAKQICGIYKLDWVGARGKGEVWQGKKVPHRLSCANGGLGKWYG